MSNIHKELDFYSLCAKYWNISRTESKIRCIYLFLEAGGTGNRGRIAEMQPHVMSHIPMDARFEMLSHYGISLGDN